MNTLIIFRPVTFAALFRADAMSIAREPVLLINLFLGLLLPLLIWWARPIVDIYALETFGIENFAQFIVPFGLILPAILIGWVTGMLLLEDRDDGPLLALEVTMIGKGGFLLYRTAVIFVLGFGASMFALQLLLPARGDLHLLLGMLTALEAVLVSFILVALAGNKVEGLALSKVVNLLAMVPLISLFASPLKYVAGLLPSFWTGEILFADRPDLSAVTVLLAVTSHLLVLVFFYHLATRRLG